MTTAPRGGRATDTETHQMRLLLPIFVRRLFEHDVVPDTVDVRTTVLWVAAVFAVPPMLIAVSLLMKYSLIAIATPQLFGVLSWPDKLFFLGYSMAAVGFVTTLVWEALFPDERDVLVLGPLPIRSRTLVVAKTTALVTFMVAFTVAINLPTTLTFAFSVGGYTNLVGFLRYLVAHLVATTAAGMFVFLVLIALHTTLTVTLPRRVVRAVTAVTQLALVVVIIEWVVYAPGALQRSLSHPSLIGRPVPELTDPYGVMAEVLTAGSNAWLPPMWFLGVYETILGTGAEGFVRLAFIGVLALALGLAVTVLAYLAGVRRVLRRIIESPVRKHARPGAARRVLGWATLATVLRHPTERAVVTFVARTLARNRRYRLIIALYLGVAIALVVGTILRAMDPEREVAFSITEPTAAILSIPLVLSFFTLVALRVVFAIPTEIRANWIVQITEQDDKASYLNGARKAMVLLGLVPIAVATVPLYVALWGPGLAVAHTVWWLLLAGLLSELLLTRFDKMPFTCSYLPGNANVKALWPLYLFVMITYAYTSARLELWLLEEPLGLTLACGGAATVLTAVIAYRQWIASGPGQLKFEEPVEPTVQTLGLMPRV